MFLELVLVAKDSMPIFFESKKKDLEEINLTAFISAVTSFAKGSFQSDLVSLKLGDLDIRLKEEDGLLYVFGMSVNTELMPSEENIEKLVQSLGVTANDWISANNMKVLDVATVPKDTFSEIVLEFEKKVLKEAENDQNTSNGSSKIVSSSVRDWNLLPLKTQDLLAEMLEPIILGERITILDNNHNAPIIKDLCSNFRLSKDLEPVLQNYCFECEISSNSDNGILFDAENNKVAGKYQKNKYLNKFINKVVNQKEAKHQDRLVSLLLNTIGTTTKSIINLEPEYQTEQGKILNLLNNIEFEEVRLILLLLQKNKPALHEKIIKLPIHKQWFNAW